MIDSIKKEMVFTFDLHVNLFWCDRLKNPFFKPFSVLFPLCSSRSTDTCVKKRLKYWLILSKTNQVKSFPLKTFLPVIFVQS